ncbi:DUF4388 domain-containing protein [Halomicronema sp. CCY15110]|uniref:DUF4388 domain-containing protein n=1 Tax=Halomicronema sp. CCY15110 TaxID=2767773 RepID=UPI00194E84CE|nr:DUF4388 domain-containing protein [Halomicronema sp. CCY15110]
MAITGHLAEFSLAEIFQFLEQGHKTGLLTITPLPEPTDHHTSRSHYIWFQQGRITTAANRSDGRGLVTLIDKRGWLGSHAAGRLLKSCDLSTPAGLCFKSQGILEADQLRMLFYIQVMQQVCALFALEDGWFHFDSSQKTPLSEATGLSAPALDVTLSGLRALKNWTVLEEKLPDPNAALISMIDGKPTLKLKQAEWQVWEFTDGRTSLKEIAKHLQLSVRQIQQIAFRLIVVSLLEEVPILKPVSTPQPPLISSQPPKAAAAEATPSPAKKLPPSSPETVNATREPVSQSFLNNLMGFLKNQA